MKNLLLTVLLLNLSGGVSCKKSKISNNEIVTVNNMSFGCRVNGQPFIADKWDFGNNISPISIDWHARPFQTKRDLVISARRDNEFIQLWLNYPFTVGQRILMYTTYPYPTTYPPRDYGLFQIERPEIKYMTNDSQRGHVDIISVDTIKNTIEAKFEFTGTDKATGQQVKITNGYFKNF